MTHCTTAHGAMAARKNFVLRDKPKGRPRELGFTAKVSDVRVTIQKKTS
jgi:hypothetical protein